MLEVSWLQGYSFRVKTDKGFELITDADNESAPCPTQILLSALGSCSATDVVDALKEQNLEALSNQLTYTLTDSEPRLYDSVNLHFKVKAAGITKTQLENAARNAINKYCHVCLMLQPQISISYSVEIVESSS